MVCYPVVIEIFKADGNKEVQGVIIMSDTKNKNFDTVKHFEQKFIQLIRTQGYQGVTYVRTSVPRYAGLFVKYANFFFDKCHSGTPLFVFFRTWLYIYF